MQTAIFDFSDNDMKMHPDCKNIEQEKVQLVLGFGHKEKLKSDRKFLDLKKKFPAADIVLCSTAGEIYQDHVLDNSLVAVAMQFDKTSIKANSVNIGDYIDSYAAAIGLASMFSVKDLVYMMIFSDGSLVNGSELVKGLSAHMPKEVLITGGLAGDGAQFSSTLTGLNNQPSKGVIIAIGFYGASLSVTHGSQGGWDIFGLEKNVTKATANTLYELDGQNALELYKKYLGEESKNLPGSALLFPLSVTIPGAVKPVVRTILSISETGKSMTFAGDLPVGSKVRFMKANFDKLTMAAAVAAENSQVNKNQVPDFSLLISCVGRKLVLGSKTDEEVKAVSKTFNEKTVMAGFYSNGEISPFNEGGNCQLHNQTMTITSFYEN